MPYVQRNAGGAVCGCYAQLQQGYAEEFLDDANQEVIAWRTKPSLDIADINNLGKDLKAVVLLIRQYTNALKAGTYAGTAADGSKTVADARADFMTIVRALP